MSPLLLISRDDAFLTHWAGLSQFGWKISKGQEVLSDLLLQVGHQTQVLLDARVLPLPLDLTSLDLFKDSQVVVGSIQPNDVECQQALMAGAAGYVHAYMPVTGLAQVLQHVASGQIWLGQDMLSRLLAQFSQAKPETTQAWASGLTVRERDVARYVALGHGNASIAQALGISERTVRAHLTVVFEKLGISDRLQLALRVHGVQLDHQNLGVSA
ncbi:response regulator transcription factor [Castellaniella sp.]|uniref:response regulator transcription factor n=1 Tax=Castellaniella sp. TaxID=1955812 RepID=UPI002AFFF81B|nr:response regulator transcription factor [Castellaniella sp.]